MYLFPRFLRPRFFRPRFLRPRFRPGFLIPAGLRFSSSSLSLFSIVIHFLKMPDMFDPSPQYIH